MKMQFFARFLSILIIISPIIRAKQHTAVRHNCLHEMPRFHITFAKMAILGGQLAAHNATLITDDRTFVLLK